MVATIVTLFALGIGVFLSRILTTLSVICLARKFSVQEKIRVSSVSNLDDLLKKGSRFELNVSERAMLESAAMSYIMTATSRSTVLSFFNRLKSKAMARNIDLSFIDETEKILAQRFPVET